MSDALHVIDTKLQDHGDGDFIIARSEGQYRVSMAFYRNIENNSGAEIVDYELAGEGDTLNEAITNMFNDIPRQPNRD